MALWLYRPLDPNRSIPTAEMAPNLRGVIATAAGDLAEQFYREFRRKHEGYTHGVIASYITDGVGAVLSGAEYTQAAYSDHHDRVGRAFYKLQSDLYDRHGQIQLAEMHFVIMTAVVLRLVQLYKDMGEVDQPASGVDDLL